MPLPEPILDGDTFFTGVNMRLDPGQLKPGFCASAKNKRFVNGKASTRPGIKKMPWSNKAADAWLEKTYNAGSIVTYSGRAAVVTGTTAAQVDGGTGNLTASSTNAIILNGDFSGSTLSPWVGGGNWSFNASTDKVSHTASSGAENLYQDISAVLGCDYTVTLTVSGYSAGTLKVFIGQSGFTAVPRAQLQSKWG